MKEFERIKNVLKVEGKVCEGLSLSTYKGGGRAYVFMPKNVKEFVNIYSALKENDKDIYILGGGSNTIISDGICKSAVISTRGLNRVEIVGDRVYCECGASVAKVMKIAREHHLGGLEFLSGVPCSIGGAIRMNAGAFSSQTKDYIDEISILNTDCAKSTCIERKEINNDNDCLLCGEYKAENTDCDNMTHIESKEINSDNGKLSGGEYRAENTDCEKTNGVEMRKKNGSFEEYSYRNGEKNIVLNAVLKLREMPREESVALAKEYVEIRRSKQPCLPSVGSVFKNGEVASGMLIEKCGLKGTRIGGAEISPKHANFIVNVGGGSADDFLALADLCKGRVFDKFGIILEEEFKIVE